MNVRLMSALLALVTIAFAGCSEGGDDGPTVTPPSPPADTTLAAFSVDNSATGCVESVGALLVEPEVAQAALPANWTAADASVLLETPAVGKGLIWFNAYSCTNSTAAGGLIEGAEFGVLANPPVLDGNFTVEAAALNIYQLFQVTSSPLVATTWSSAGFPVTLGNASVEVGRDVTVAATGTATVGNATGPLFSFTFNTVSTEPFTGTANFWHESWGGLAYAHYELTDVTVLQGPISSCVFSAGLVQDTTQSTTCNPSNALALFAPQQQWVSSFNWVPGAHALAA